MKKEIEYYDIVLKRMIKLLSFDDEVTILDLEERYKDDLYRAAFKALKMMAEEKLNIVPWFRINIDVTEISRKYYKEHLDNCIEYFTSTEEYEICSELINLDKTLKL